MEGGRHKPSNKDIVHGQWYLGTRLRVIIVRTGFAVLSSLKSKKVMSTHYSYIANSQLHALIYK
ncbi:hypothetical protein GCM10009000_064410 [Halobacterium noricense]|uniref:Transposase n=1 Tax=Haladaptatus pallidirubidus TaxID=1008152 RepID=A0AAV3UI28_9EURY